MVRFVSNQRLTGVYACTNRVADERWLRMSLEKRLWLLWVVFLSGSICRSAVLRHLSGMEGIASFREDRAGQASVGASQVTLVLVLKRRCIGYPFPCRTRIESLVSKGSSSESWNPKRSRSGICSRIRNRTFSAGSSSLGWPSIDSKHS